jgi:hypothetical protein
MFNKLISIWTNNAGEKIKVWQTSKDGLSHFVQYKHHNSNFFGSYDKLKKTLSKDGYREMTHEFNNEKFIDNVVAEALKAGEKVAIPDTAVAKMKLSAAAKKALTLVGSTEAELKKIAAEQAKHADEYEKLNALLNKLSKKRDETERKAKKLKEIPNAKDLKYFSLIEEVCSDFIKDAKASNTFLYRGMSTGAEVIYGKPYTNRTTKDTSEETQKLFDKFLTLTGFKALRSNSIFVTSKYSHARNYGQKVYVIFPRNKFNFTWSAGNSDWIPKMSELIPKDNTVPLRSELISVLNDAMYAFEVIIDDSTWFYKPGTLDTYDDKTSDEIREKLKKDPIVKQLYNEAEKIKNALKEQTYITRTVVKPFVQFFKKILNLEYNYKINFRFLPIDRTNRTIVMDTIKFASDKTKQKTELELAQNFIKNEKIQTGDLKKALDSGNEIYISGEYIAFSVKPYLVKLSNYFGIKLPYEFQ